MGVCVRICLCVVPSPCWLFEDASLGCVCACVCDSEVTACAWKCVRDLDNEMVISLFGRTVIPFAPIIPLSLCLCQGTDRSEEHTSELQSR